MDRLISLDLGFDRKALDHPRLAGTVPLQLGFTIPSQEGNPVAQARSLHTNDRILLTLYDLTEIDAVSSPVRELSFDMRFSPARSQKHEFPVMHDHYGKFRIRPGPASPGKSTVFATRDEVFPVWRILQPDSRTQEFPHNQLDPDEPEPGRERFVFRFCGHFYLSACLRVVWELRGDLLEKRFCTDPEMIVHDNGPVPDEVDDWHPESPASPS